MKVSSIILLLSTLTSSAFALTIPIEARDLVERTPPKGNKVTQNANSNNWIESTNNGGYASNSDTTAKSGKKGTAVAIPVAIAKGADTDVTFGKATNTNTNKSGGNKVKQNANSGNTILSSGNGGSASNDNTEATSGKKGTAIAVPIAYASGGDTTVKFGDASNTNTNEKRGGHHEEHPKGNKVTQNANSGNTVSSTNNGGYAENKNTKADGYLVGVAVPIAVAGGGDTDTTFGKAKNTNTNKSGGNKTKQNANSGNTIISSGNGGSAENDNTSAKGGLIGVAVPIAVAGGGDTITHFGDATNENTNH